MSLATQSVWPRILVVEDELKLAALLADYLKASDMTPVTVHDGAGALPAFEQQQPALVLLDLNLPGRDGLSICRALRERSTVPIVIMTARVDEIDRLIGLDAGADDYICKPYSPREVVARVKAQLRRAGWAQTSAAVPTALHAAPGRVFSRQQLLDHLHDDGRAVTDRVIDSHVRNLRRKLAGSELRQDPIRSVYGVGYAFEWNITLDTDTPQQRAASTKR